MDTERVSLKDVVVLKGNHHDNLHADMTPCIEFRPETYVLTLERSWGVVIRERANLTVKIWNICKNDTFILSPNTNIW
jgi:hypothetical protein